MGQQQASPLAIVIAILVLLVVLFALYKLTIDKDSQQPMNPMDKGGKMMGPGGPMPGMMGNSTSPMPAPPPVPPSVPGS